MAMQTLIPDHILEKCLNCEFLRCVKNDPNSQFKCSLCRSKLGMGGGLGLLSPSHQIDLTVRQCEGREGLVNLATITEKIEADYIRGLIGFSTVCLPERVKFDDKLNVYWRVQATVLELCFPTPAKLLAFAPTKEKIVLIKKFGIVIIHAPWQGLSYFDNTGNTDQLIIKLVQLAKIFPVSGVIFHPDTIANFNGLEVIPLPVLIENASGDKKFGSTVEDIARIKRDYGVNFSFNIQQAWKSDPTMKLADEMILAMADRIRCLRASGQSGNDGQVPVHLADNYQEICQKLRMIPNVPVVLEGRLSGKVLTMAKNELSFVAKNGHPLN